MVVDEKNRSAPVARHVGQIADLEDLPPVDGILQRQPVRPESEVRAVALVCAKGAVGRRASTYTPTSRLLLYDLRKLGFGHCE